MISLYPSGSGPSMPNLRHKLSSANTSYKYATAVGWSSEATSRGWGGAPFSAGISKFCRSVEPSLSFLFRKNSTSHHARKSSLIP